MVWAEFEMEILSLSDDMMRTSVATKFGLKIRFRKRGTSDYRMRDGKGGHGVGARQRKCLLYQRRRRGAFPPLTPQAPRGTHLPEELEGGVAGDPREDGALAEGRRDHLRLPWGGGRRSHTKGDDRGDSRRSSPRGSPELKQILAGMSGWRQVRVLLRGDVHSVRVLLRRLFRCSRPHCVACEASGKPPNPVVACHG